MDFQTLTVAGRPIVSWVEVLAEKLRQLKDAVESRDLVLLGDILRYEIDPALRDWEQMLAGLIQHIVEMRDKPAACSA
jgi:predicted nucleotidyltransferase component of viral defense system